MNSGDEYLFWTLLLPFLYLRAFPGVRFRYFASVVGSVCTARECVDDK